MKVRLGDIIGSTDVLAKIFGVSVKSAGATYRIVRLKKEISDVISDYEKVRLECLNRYSTPVDEEGNVVEQSDRRMFVKTDDEGNVVLEDGKAVSDEGKWEKFAKEMSELLAAEQEISSYLKQDDHELINDALETPLSPDEVFAIRWCLDELRDMYEEELSCT